MRTREVLPDQQQNVNKKKPRPDNRQVNRSGVTTEQETTTKPSLSEWERSRAPLWLQDLFLTISYKGGTRVEAVPLLSPLFKRNMLRIQSLPVTGEFHENAVLPAFDKSNRNSLMESARRLGMKVMTRKQADDTYLIWFKREGK